MNTGSHLLTLPYVKVYKPMLQQAALP